MGDKIIEGLVSVAVAVIGIAIVAVIVGRGSQTASVLSAGGNAFSSIIKAATSPVAGGGIQ